MSTDKSGNQGLDFRYINREGFGWSNASFQVGLQCLTPGMRRAVAAGIPPWDYFGLPTPDLPVIRRREDKEAHMAEVANRTRRKSYVAPGQRTFEQTIADLKALKV